MGVYFRIPLPGPFAYAHRIGGGKKRRRAPAKPAAQPVTKGSASVKANVGITRKLDIREDGSVALVLDSKSYTVLLPENEEPRVVQPMEYTDNTELLSLEFPDSSKLAVGMRLGSVVTIVSKDGVFDSMWLGWPFPGDLTITEES